MTAMLEKNCISVPADKQPWSPSVSYHAIMWDCMWRSPLRLSFAHVPSPVLYHLHWDQTSLCSNALRMLMLKKEEGDHQLCGALISLTQTSSLYLPPPLLLSLSFSLYLSSCLMSLSAKLDHVVSDSLTTSAYPGSP